MDTTTTSLPLILRALSFAADKHRNQRRKDRDASPYINHPIALANLLVNEGGVTDPVVICSALLHDTIEDTETTLDELIAQFGREIAGVVSEVTDDKALPKEVRKQRQVEHAAHASQEAKLVKLADKICNLQDIIAHPPADWPTERKMAYFEWAKRVVDQLGPVNDAMEALFNRAYANRLRSLDS
jgi:guanosine-3',5'-bis(diphosphate) 3'-pyrophosphohydrolase